MKTKICPICGTVYEASGKQTYCKNRHTKLCLMCGTEFEVPYHRLSEYNNITTCGSKACASKIRSQSMKSAAQMLPAGWNTHKISVTKVCKECGQEFTTLSNSAKYCSGQHESTCVICGNNFVVPNGLLGSRNRPRVCSEDCRQVLSKQTMYNKYGAESYSSTDEYRQRMKMNHDEWLAKKTATMLERYGTTSTTQWKQNQVSDESKLAELQTFKCNPIEYIQSHWINKPTVGQLVSALGINESSVLDMVHKMNIEDMIAIHRSTMEAEVTEVILSIDPNIRIVHNCRKVISPLEIDIYLPDYNIGIECNPTVTHNCSARLYPDVPHVPYNYHKIKTDRCEEAKVFLFHIFGYEWTHRREIVESMIRNLLDANETKIHARKCEIKEVSGSEARLFLDANHRQGSVDSHIRLGLFYNGELVSLMTFGKMRASIGTGKEDLSNCHELVRFCSKVNTSVVGGADKLFKHFVKTYNPIQIRSFSDRAHTRGTLYSKLGFREIRRSEANYVWVNVYEDKAYHRTNTQKQNLKKFLNDETVDLSRSEKQIMEEHGFVQVFDSGTITWEWTN